MEILMRTTVERALVLTCCLIIAPTITTTPIEDLGLNSENTIRVSRFYYPGVDSSKGDRWTHSSPRFSKTLREELLESKRRSSFFPVRGKKISQSDHSKAEAPRRYSVSAPDATSSDGRTFLPLINGAPSSSYGVPQKRPSSFMPMRGRKLNLNENNLELLKHYLSSTMRGNSLGPAYGKDEMDFPNFFDTAIKDYLDRDQAEQHLRFLHGDLLPPESLSGEKLIPTKRALSFVPTRGRREKSGELASEFLQHMSRPTAGRPEVSSARRQSVANLSRHYDAEGKGNPRYHRATAFLPMRGRKSSGSPHWLAYNYRPRNVEQAQRFWNLAGSNSMENTGQQASKADEMQGLIFGEDLKYVGRQREKKNSNEEELLSSASKEKLRTALVMKRPLSFFAARGKRLNSDGVTSH